jgi:hypothetical protein
VDLRDAAFDLVFQDVVLRPLLVNAADRLDCASAPDGAPRGRCFVRLSWMDGDSRTTPPDREVLTAQVHMPRQSGAEDAYLGVVLERLHLALAGLAADGVITTRCLDMSPRVSESACGTVFMASTFEITPPPDRHCAVAGLGAAPWSEWADDGTADPFPPSGGTPA